MSLYLKHVSYRNHIKIYNPATSFTIFHLFFVSILFFSFLNFSWLIEYFVGSSCCWKEIFPVSLVFLYIFWTRTLTAFQKQSWKVDMCPPLWYALSRVIKILSPSNKTFGQFWWQPSSDSLGYPKLRVLLLNTAAWAHVKWHLTHHWWVWGLGGYVLWTECLCHTPHPQNSCIETAVPSGVVLGCGAFGTQLGCKGGALMMALVPFAKRPQRAGAFPLFSLPPSFSVIHEDDPHQTSDTQCSDLGLPSLRDCEKRKPASLRVW